MPDLRCFFSLSLKGKKKKVKIVYSLQSKISAIQSKTEGRSHWTTGHRLHPARCFCDAGCSRTQPRARVCTFSVAIFTLHQQGWGVQQRLEGLQSLKYLLPSLLQEKKKMPTTSSRKTNPSCEIRNTHLKACVESESMTKKEMLTIRTQRWSSQILSVFH